MPQCIASIFHRPKTSLHTSNEMYEACFCPKRPPRFGVTGGCLQALRIACIFEPRNGGAAWKSGQIRFLPPTPFDRRHAGRVGPQWTQGPLQKVKSRANRQHWALCTVTMTAAPHTQFDRQMRRHVVKRKDLHPALMGKDSCTTPVLPPPSPSRTLAATPARASGSPPSQNHCPFEPHMGRPPRPPPSPAAQDLPHRSSGSIAPPRGHPEQIDEGVTRRHRYQNDTQPTSNAPAPSNTTYTAARGASQVDKLDHIMRGGSLLPPPFEGRYPLSTHLPTSSNVGQHSFRGMWKCLNALRRSFIVQKRRCIPQTKCMRRAFAQKDPHVLGLRGVACKP